MSNRHSWKRLPSSREGHGDHTLVICEKPDAARRVAEALCETAPEVFRIGKVYAFRLEDARGRRFVVCAAAGHLYGLAETVKNRRVYPVADLEWFPLSVSRPRAATATLVASRIKAIKTLSDEASRFINACDFDIEGETIGYNILRYACGGKDLVALRARFSSLTRDEVLRAFDEGALVGKSRLAIAGRLRHAIDFLWGVNLSRALSESIRTSHGFRVISMGRVQGPTLNFVVEREIGINTHVPMPYWTALGKFSKGGVIFDAKYISTRTITTKRLADEIRTSCEGRDGVIRGASTAIQRLPPPPPFNLPALQKEAFTHFGYSPKRTLEISERLYLAAMISYPRTASQRLPNLDYGRVIARIALIPSYAKIAKEVLSRTVLQPTEGRGEDSAHPAIYPTGESARRMLTLEERNLFDLIVRRFLACFCDEAVYELRVVKILVGEHEFGIETRNLVSVGWKSLALGADGRENRPTPDLRLKEGDLVRVDRIIVEGRLTMAAQRYNQATLMEKMEREGIGTKATRADVISTLVHRGYVAERHGGPTEMGFALVEAMQDYCPQIISVSFTKEIESQLEKIESSEELKPEFFEMMLSELMSRTREVRAHRDEISRRVNSFSIPGNPGQVILGRCPVCRDGRLVIVRSRKSGKRFVGCTNYGTGCTASAPLPQRGSVGPTRSPCRTCGWPVVNVRLGTRPWRLCVNDRCPRKVNVYTMRKLQRNR